jgi:SAM-dependent methyltransferase
MKECSKSVVRRLHDPAFVARYFAGHGLDIGGKPDPLCLYEELFPRIEGVRTWDIEDGDAQFLTGVADDSYDFVHSSHCLEHLHDPAEGLRNWFRVLKPGGHLILTVPDEDMYEQGEFPSTFNRDHKWTFTVFKERSWSDRSISLLPLILSLGARAEPVKVQLLDATYRALLPRYDQSITPVAECGIEAVIRKRSAAETENGARARPDPKAASREMRIHLNQYRDDRATLRQANTARPPFTNDDPL